MHCSARGQHGKHIHPGRPHAPCLGGRAPNPPRKGFIHFSDDGDLVALRFEWTMHSGYLAPVGQGVVSRSLEIFEDLTRRRRAASFTIDQAAEKMNEAAAGAYH
jgi:hypothetical protein